MAPSSAMGAGRIGDDLGGDGHMLHHGLVGAQVARAVMEQHPFIAFQQAIAVPGLAEMTTTGRRST